MMKQEQYLEVSKNDWSVLEKIFKQEHPKTCAIHSHHKNLGEKGRNHLLEDIQHIRRCLPKKNNSEITELLIEMNTLAFFHEIKSEVK